MFTKEVLEGARNYIKWCDIQAGDKVMIVHSVIPPVPDEEVIEAITIASEEKGAHAYTLGTRPYNILFDKPPDYVNEAAKGCDVFVGLALAKEAGAALGSLLGPGYGGVVGLKKFLARWGTSWQPCRMGTVEDMSSDHARYPHEVLVAIARAVVNRFVNGKTCRVTTPTGTDVTMGINSDYWGGNCTWQKKPGTFPGTGWPGAVYGIVPWQPYNGRIVVDAFMPHWRAGKIFLEPGEAVVTVENNRAIATEGVFADWMSEILDRDKNARWGAEMMFGIHPHACPVPWQSPADWFNDLHDHPTALHLAFGNCIGGSGPYYSVVHFDLYTYYPTVYIDGEKLIDNGHLTVLEDPELREFAKQFGDPDYLLTEKAIPGVVNDIIKR